MRRLALAASLIVVLGAFAGLGFAVQSFDSHQGLPSHIGLGTRYGHVAAGESDVISGRALGAKPDTTLLLDAQTVPYDRTSWQVIASTSHLGPGGSFSFVVRPRVQTHYQVFSAVDHLERSRVVGIVVDPSPR